MESEIKKVYLAGPMTGYEDNNSVAFVAACQDLRDQGFEVVSPKELNEEHAPDQTWEFYLRHDIERLVRCEGVVVLSGWAKSKGATLKCYIAWRLGMPIIRYPEMIPVEPFILESYLCHGGLR